MRITSDIVTLVAEEIEIMTDGAFRLGHVSRPEKGQVHYADGIAQKVWTGVNSGRRAVAYYLGALDVHLSRTGCTWEDTEGTTAYTVFTALVPPVGPLASSFGEGMADAEDRLNTRSSDSDSHDHALINA